MSDKRNWSWIVMSMLTIIWVKKKMLYTLFQDVMQLWFPDLGKEHITWILLLCFVCAVCCLGSCIYTPFDNWGHISSGPRQPPNIVNILSCFTLLINQVRFWDKKWKYSVQASNSRVRDGHCGHPVDPEAGEWTRNGHYDCTKSRFFLSKSNTLSTEGYWLRKYQLGKATWGTVKT